jgi:hypothetical protein
MVTIHPHRVAETGAHGNPAVFEGSSPGGNVVLFLGSGASLDAKHKDGRNPPTAKKLGELLSDKFLGGGYRTDPLSQIAEYAIAVSDVVTVQQYVRTLLLGFEPTEAHKLVVTFRWRAIATTNYDRILEEAYENNRNAVQKLTPLVDGNDRIDELMRDLSAVAVIVYRLSKAMVRGAVGKGC